MAVEISSLWSLWLTDFDKNMHVLSMPINAGQPNHHMLCQTRVELMHLGQFERCLNSCSQCCAIFWNLKKKDVSHVLKNLVHPYFKNKTTPCVENATYNGEAAKPPVIKKQQLGHPRAKCVSWHSEFPEQEECPIEYSYCGMRTQ
jgi:hypothetical protein